MAFWYILPNRCIRPIFVMNVQGSFCVCAQLIRDDVTIYMECRLPFGWAHAQKDPWICHDLCYSPFQTSPSLYRPAVISVEQPKTGLLPDTQNCGLLMRRECRERFPRYRFQGKPPCVTHVPWCMSGSLTRGGVENVPGIPGARTTRNFAYQIRDPWSSRNVTHVSQQLWLRSRLW